MTATTVVAICALVVSVASLVASIYFSWCARDHNRRSVKPLPFVLQSDFEDRIAVVIRNDGTGPLILQGAEAKDPTNGRSGHLIDLIPEPPQGLLFTNFNRVQQIRAIRPGDQVDLLDLAVNQGDGRAAAYRDQLRRALGSMTLGLTYTDIYDTPFRVYAIKLAWFHRDFPPSA